MKHHSVALNLRQQCSAIFRLFNHLISNEFLIQESLKIIRKLSQSILHHKYHKCALSDGSNELTI